MNVPGAQESSSAFTSLFTRIMGLSMIASLFNGGLTSRGGLGTTANYMFDSARLLVLGTLLEAGRRFFQWLVERFRLQYSITAQFTEGDPTFEWIVVYMTEKKIWKRSRDFRINARSSVRRWGIQLTDDAAEGGAAHIDLVPTYELPHLFRWNGVWIETKRGSTVVGSQPSSFGGFNPGVIHLTMYTLDIKALHEFVEEARLCYVEHGRASVILHTASQNNFGPGFVWNCCKRKLRRPISSIILEDGMMEALVADAREFIEMENWYIEAGIPHRRGYLLHGPPGTGKTSTIHALAGELGLEIFSLSLSAGFVDDAFLQQAASSIPKKAIFLIEDIDCAFATANRMGEGNGFDTQPTQGFGVGFMGSGFPAGAELAMQSFKRSSVTLSGLLNVIDGIGSEEGVLFFATTNCIKHLDSALLRPGRIDRKVKYGLTSKSQAAALFNRFFPATHVTLQKDECSMERKKARLSTLAEEFADNIPEHEFSTAELQGFLLSCKREPEQAARGVKLWVDQEREEKKHKTRFTKAVNREERPRSTFGAFPASDGVGVSGAFAASATSSTMDPTAVTSGDAPGTPMTPPHTPPLVPKEGGQDVSAICLGHLPVSSPKHTRATTPDPQPMPISDCWPALEPSLALLDAPTHKRITSLHEHLLPFVKHIEDYASSVHPKRSPCRMVTSSWTWGQSFLVYELVFEAAADAEESWVARFGLPPYEGDEFFNTPEQLERKILNEVGALRVVKQRTTVPVPDIFGFCACHGDGFQHKFSAAPPSPNSPHSRSPHPLGEDFPAFILMSAMKGKTIEDCGIPIHELGGHWESPTSDPSYEIYLKSPILQRYLASLADIHVQLSQITFPQIGSFTLDYSENGHGEVQIGPMAEFGLGPFNTAQEYYAVLAEAFKRIAESAAVEDEEEEEEESGEPVAIKVGDSDETISLPRSEIKPLRRMFAASLFPVALAPHILPENNCGPFPLRHGDLHSENILVDEHTGEIIGVIDWEGAGTVPWEVAGALNWEVQGEVLEAKHVPGLGLVRPEVHAAFNKALKAAEERQRLLTTSAQTASTLRERRLQNASGSFKLSLAEQRRSSTMSSFDEYYTPMTSMSASSSYVSLNGSDKQDEVTVEAPPKPKSIPISPNSTTSSASSSRASFTDDLESSRSNVNLTSPLTSPATSMFDVGSKADKKEDESSLATPNPTRKSESGASKLKSWFGFSRAASEGTSQLPAPISGLPQPAPLAEDTPSVLYLRPPLTPTPNLLPTPMIEAVREPIPEIQTHCITTPEQEKPSKSTGGEESLSLSLAAMAITDPGSLTTRSAFPRLGGGSAGSPPTPHARSPLTISPRPQSMHLRYSSISNMSMHKRRQSTMALSIPCLEFGNMGLKTPVARVSTSAGRQQPSARSRVRPGHHRQRRAFTALYPVLMDGQDIIVTPSVRRRSTYRPL
ncbi:hypothetical protein NMY22_g12457 [Coprinellus aureogranulatus]|nr:hypothetical protein NMY22_g12457 [Coprinellus aureogranulatus]